MISTTIPHLVLLPLLLASAGGAALWIAALISVLRTAAAWRALVWVVLTLVFPVVGPVVWFVAGRGYERTVAARTNAARDTHVLAH